MARSLSESGGPERCFTRLGSGLTYKHHTRLERLARDKHSSLLQKFVNYGHKKVYRIGPWYVTGYVTEVRNRAPEFLLNQLKRTCDIDCPAVLATIYGELVSNVMKFFTAVSYDFS
jgi:hypothetical protein